jgi:signal transduction histidine kinase
MARPDPLIESKREEQRLSAARRVTLIRLGSAAVWVVYDVVFGVYGHHADLRSNIPFTGIYFLAALALYLGGQRSAAILRRSWLALPLVDVPLIFLTQYRGIPLARTPVGTAAFAVGILAVLIFIAQLSMRRRNIFATAAVAMILEIVLLIRAGIDIYGWAAVVMLYSIMAVAAAAVIDQLSALLRDVVTERARISREIHDTLAQGLTGISVQLEAGVETLFDSPELARAHLDRARILVRSSLAEARRSVWNLRPEALETAGLPHALSESARELAADSRATIRFDIRGVPRRLSPEVEANLLRIGQEAITNATKHANAYRICVELQFDQHLVSLRVWDDGCGFIADDSAMATSHFGLLGMRERAEKIGGSLVVSSRPGLGTEIALAVSA